MQQTAQIGQQSTRTILSHFGLREDPFGPTPNPRFLYLSEKHREALAALEYGIQCGRGFLVLTAPPGLGKTTLLYHMLEKYRISRTASTAFIFQTQCDSRELVRHVVKDFGLGPDDQNIVRMQQDLNQFLVQEANLRRQVVVFIDEAQNLGEDVLETVRLLSNFETLNSKLLQVVLCGQPLLAAKLASPGLVQMRQRIFSTFHLEPLNPVETSGYIDHRLSVAGYNGSEFFTPEARSSVITHSCGIPRIINALCFRAMTLAYAVNAETIDETIARKAIDDLAFPELTTLAPIDGTPVGYEDEGMDIAPFFPGPPKRSVAGVAEPGESVIGRVGPGSGGAFAIRTNVSAAASTKPDAGSATRKPPAAQEFPVSTGNSSLVRRVKVRDKVPVEQLPGVLEAIRTVESELDGQGHIVVRYSDRGKSVRVIIEADNEALRKKYCDAIANALLSEIGA